MSSKTKKKTKKSMNWKEPLLIVFVGIPMLLALIYVVVTLPFLLIGFTALFVKFSFDHPIIGLPIFFAFVVLIIGYHYIFVKKKE